MPTPDFAVRKSLANELKELVADYLRSAFALIVTMNVREKHVDHFMSFFFNQLLLEENDYDAFQQALCTEVILIVQEPRFLDAGWTKGKRKQFRRRLRQQVIRHLPLALLTTQTFPETLFQQYRQVWNYVSIRSLKKNYNNTKT